MFIISIDGGLGNQMFEYAFYLSMQNCYPNSKIYLDTSMIKETVHNGYELDRVFEIHAPMASLDDVIKYSEYCPPDASKSKIINSLNKIRRCIWGVKQSYIVQEDSTAYYENYYHLNELYSYYLRGVWANVKYFAHIKEKILESFTFPDLKEEKNRSIAAEIQNSNSISIHFRKGDYVQFGFEILGEEYFLNAMRYMNERVDNPKFFVFSGDIDSAKKIFGVKNNLVFINGNANKDSYIDMQLMSLCQHNIVANSTFSFWGAYLNRNSNKLVVYPKMPLRGCRYPYAEEQWIGI